MLIQIYKRYALVTLKGKIDPMIHEVHINQIGDELRIRFMRKMKGGRRLVAEAQVKRADTSRVEYEITQVLEQFNHKPKPLEMYTDDSSE